MPHPLFAQRFGIQPSVSFPMFTPLEQVNEVRDWCQHNLKPSHRFADSPLYDSDKRNLIGYTVTISSDEEDLFLITLAN